MTWNTNDGPSILRALRAGGCARPGIALNYVSTAREAIAVITTTDALAGGAVSEGRCLYSMLVSCKYAATAAVYLQLHNLRTGTAPSNGSIVMPLGIIMKGEVLPFEMDGMSFSNGIQLVESSTEDTYTATGTSDLWVSAWYGTRAAS